MSIPAMMTGRLERQMTGDTEGIRRHHDCKDRQQKPFALDAAIDPHAAAAGLFDLPNVSIEVLGHAKGFRHLRRRVDHSHLDSPPRRAKGHQDTNVGNPTLNFHAGRRFPFSVAKITRSILGPPAIARTDSTFVGSATLDGTAATTSTRQWIVAADKSQVML